MAQQLLASAALLPFAGSLTPDNVAQYLPTILKFHSRFAASTEPPHVNRSTVPIQSTPADAQRRTRHTMQLKRAKPEGLDRQPLRHRRSRQKYVA